MPVETAMEIHRREGPGDVPVFLTGEDEIETAVNMLQEAARDGSATAEPAVKRRDGPERRRASPTPGSAPRSRWRRSDPRPGTRARSW